MGIEPKVSTADEALKILKKNYGSENVVRDDRAGVITWNADNPDWKDRGNVFIGNNMVGFILLFFRENTIEVKDLIAEIGNPDSVGLVVSGPVVKCAGASLLYPRAGLQVYLYSIDKSVGVSKTQAVSGFGLFGADGLGAIGSSQFFMWLWTEIGPNGSLALDPLSVPRQHSRSTRFCLRMCPFVTKGTFLSPTRLCIQEHDKMLRLLPILPCQAGNLQSTTSQHSLLLNGQYAFFDHRKALHIVHGADDADGDFDAPFHKGAQILDSASEELTHLIVRAGGTHETRQHGG